MASAVRADGGTDEKPDGGGIHPGEDTSSLPLRPPGAAAGAHQPGRGNGVAGEYDEWGNLLGETSAQQLQQPYRLPGQQYDEESGLYYNRNRYYDPLQGRYITRDPIGLRGAWNLYQYPLNPTTKIDPLGLSGEDSIEQSGPSWLIADPMDKYRQQAVMGLTKLWDDTFSQEKTKCLPTTPENIRMVVANSPLLTVQQKVSVPVVAHYVQMLEDGSGAPPVDMDGNVIVNGNHRMVAGLLCDKLPPERPVRVHYRHHYIRLAKIFRS